MERPQTEKELKVLGGQPCTIKYSDTGPIFGWFDECLYPEGDRVDNRVRVKYVIHGEVVNNTAPWRIISLRSATEQLKTEGEQKMAIKLSPVVKQNLTEDQAIVIEAFTLNSGQLDITSPEFAAWFLKKFGADKTFVTAAKAYHFREAQSK